MKKSNQTKTEPSESYAFHINENNDKEIQRLRDTIEAKIADQQKELTALKYSQEMVESLHNTYYKVKSYARLSGLLEDFLIKHSDEFQAAINETMRQLNAAIAVEKTILLEFKE